jgi:hypothetical protein
MDHPETETQATENISANPHNISKVIKNMLGTIVMFGACIVVCHVFGWMPS